MDRERAREDLRKMQEQREKLREERADVNTEGQTSDFRFRLNGVEHNPSEVLTDEEIDEAVAPFLGREVSMADVKNMLAAINARYREKGYVVCEARLKPQRIRAGRLFVTLIEGKTGGRYGDRERAECSGTCRYLPAGPFPMYTLQRTALFQ